MLAVPMLAAKGSSMHFIPISERGRACNTPESRTPESAALDTATFDVAVNLQEAMACVGLMRLRTGVMPSPSDFKDLADRLARAEAFRLVAVAARRARLVTELSGRRYFWQRWALH